VYYINYPKNVPFTIDGKTGEIKVKKKFSKICWYFNKDIYQTATSQGYFPNGNFPRIFPKWKLPNSAISQVCSKTLLIETQTVAQLKAGLAE